jgi:hypothetical protein
VKKILYHYLTKYEQEQCDFTFKRAQAFQEGKEQFDMLDLLVIESTLELLTVRSNTRANGKEYVPLHKRSLEEGEGEIIL